MNDTFITILYVVSHYMVFLHKSKWWDFGYPLLVIPDMILVSMYFTNLVGVSYCLIAVYT